MNRTAAAAVKKATAQQEVQEAVVLVAAEVDSEDDIGFSLFHQALCDESIESTHRHRRPSTAAQVFPCEPLRGVCKLPLNL